MNRELIAATGSVHKVKEISAILPSNWSLKSLKDIGFEGEIVEDGETLEENALIKARHIHTLLGKDVFAEDTGLEVEALDWRPGVHTARYAGDDRHDGKNMALVLQNLQGKQSRKARFRTVIALIQNDVEYLFEGIVEGSIGVQPSGTGGFGYDPIFIPDGFSESFGVLSDEIKNTISHRARAVSKLVTFLKNGTKGQDQQGVMTSYDAMADEYSRQLKDELSYKHLDRILLKAFAEENKSKGLMLDLGCGPGQTTYFMSNCGVGDLNGIDLSPVMIEHAKALYPGISFLVGDMLDLPYIDASVGSVIAFYAIVNFDLNGVSQVVQETYRVLKHGSDFLFSFHIGEGVKHMDTMMGASVDIDFYFFGVDVIKDLALNAGFELVDIVERYPYKDVEYQGKRAYIWLRKG